VPDDRSKERPELLVHPDDATERTLADGDEVEVATASGAVRATVRLDDRVRPGTVSLPHGWSGTNVCHLTDPHDVDPLTTQPRMSGFRVELRA
jgi:anaerobic selenocysteine-containing dehydrogenase